MSLRASALAGTLALAGHAFAFEPRPVPIASFFRPSEVELIALDGDGRFFVSIVRFGSTREVRVHRRATSEHATALATKLGVDPQIEWVGADRFVISSARRRGTKWANEVVVVAETGDDLIRERYWVESKGWVVHPLPAEDGFALFARDDSESVCVTHHDVDNDEPLEPRAVAVDWDAGFGAALNKQCASILSPALDAVWPQLLETVRRSESDTAGCRRALLRASHRVWSGERLEIEIADLVREVGAEKGISSEVKSAISGLLQEHGQRP